MNPEETPVDSLPLCNPGCGWSDWSAQTTESLQALLPQDPLAVLPMAAIEQHGAHLPLATDAIIGAALLRKALPMAVAAGPILVLPEMTIGASMEHQCFPGTLTFEPETALAMLRDLAAALARTGIRRLLISNSHGGNTALIDLAALRMRRDHGLLVVKFHYFRIPLPAGVHLPPAEREHGWHGGAIETALMLHLAPAQLRMEHLADCPSLGETMAKTLHGLRPEGAVSFAWMAQDLHPRGTVGDARLATARLGAQLAEHYARALAETLLDSRRFSLPTWPPDSITPMARGPSGQG